jgi:autophagy-related protein 17
MSSSEASSSQGSPSPQASPVASVHDTQAKSPDLGQLVVYFVAAKRSLEASSHVYRATELVTSSRALIEDIAVLNAKNLYASRALTSQLDILREVESTVIDEADQISISFDATLASLDEADRRLQQTLDALRQTVVDAKLGRRQSAQLAQSSKQSIVGKENSTSLADSEAVTSAKSLLDFIDETTHGQLLTSLYALIDAYHHARNGVEQSLLSYRESVKLLTALLAEPPQPPDKPTIYDEPPPTISELFRNLEGHATDIAMLLNNLVSHYDLCVTALKHTEGGGEAARLAVQAADGMSKADITADKTEESLYNKTTPEPISLQERLEMLAVLEGDAVEVADVTQEIKDLASAMELQYSQLTRHAQQARTRHKVLRQLLSRLHHFHMETLPVHVQLTRVFVSQTWPELHTDLQKKTTELVDLCAFYESFLSGYAALLEEVRRRAASETQMRQTADKARRELAKLFEAERSAREIFMADVGEYLPRDIWDGLEEDVRKWEVRRAERAE